jgi:hypothetical protein
MPAVMTVEATVSSVEATVSGVESSSSAVASSTRSTSLRAPSRRKIASASSSRWRAGSG